MKKIQLDKLTMATVTGTVVLPIIFAGAMVAVPPPAHVRRIRETSQPTPVVVLTTNRGALSSSILFSRQNESDQISGEIVVPNRIGRLIEDGMTIVINDSPYSTSTKRSFLSVQTINGYSLRDFSSTRRVELAQQRREQKQQERLYRLRQQNSL